MRTTFLIFILSLACVNASFAESMTIKTGKVYQGDIFEKTDEYVKLNTETGRVKIPFNFLNAESREMVKQIPNFNEGEERPNGTAAQQTEVQKTSQDGPLQEIPTSSTLTADEIIQKMIAGYRAMNSYSVQGIAEQNVKMSSFGKGPYKNLIEFTVQFKKPNFYKIVGQSKSSDSLKMKSVVWNSGEGPYVMIANQYHKATSDKMAMGSATAFSGPGVAFLMSSLFFDFDIKPLEDYTRFKLLGSQNVNGQECFVITSESRVSTDERFWISKDKYLIVRHAFKMDKKPEMPKYTDEQMDESIKEMGMEVNAENREKMKQMMEVAKSSMKDMKFEDFTSQEDYKNILVNAEIAQKEFANEVPPDAQGQKGFQQNFMKLAFQNMDGMKFSMLAAQGIQLTAKEAAELESKVAAKPDDFETRLKLLGYYLAKTSPEDRMKRLNHIKWIVQNKPDYSGGPSMGPWLDVIPMAHGERAYDEVKQMWLEQVLKHPKNVKVLMNAAAFLYFADQDLAEKFIAKAKAIDPNAVSFKDMLEQGQKMLRSQKR